MQNFNSCSLGKRTHNSSGVAKQNSSLSHKMVHLNSLALSKKKKNFTRADLSFAGEAESPGSCQETSRRVMKAPSHLDHIATSRAKSMFKIFKTVKLVAPIKKILPQDEEYLSTVESFTDISNLKNIKNQGKTGGQWKKSQRDHSLDCISDSSSEDLGIEEWQMKRGGDQHEENISDSQLDISLEWAQRRPNDSESVIPGSPCYEYIESEGSFSSSNSFDMDLFEQSSKNDSFMTLMEKEGLLEGLKELADQDGEISYEKIKGFLLPNRRIPSFKRLYLLRLAEIEILLN